MKIPKKQRIIGYAVERGLSEDALAFLSAAVDLSESGIVKRFAIRWQNSIIRDIFGMDNARYLEAYMSLRKEDIVELKGLDLIILAWDDAHLYSLKLSLPKRKYSRNVLHEQMEIWRYCRNLEKTPESPERVLEPHRMEKPEVKWDKIMGVKFPRSLSHLLTGKSQSHEGRTEEEIIAAGDKSVSKEMVRYICGLAAQCDSNGEIRDFNRLYAINRMQELFDCGTMKTSTCYDVHKKLLDMGIIEEYVKPATGEPCLRISGYAEGFGKGRNYVVIPYAVFRAVFKETEIGAIRLFFDWVFKLNNGEDGKGGTDRNKAVLFKAFATGLDTGRDRAKYQGTLQWLKKRCRSEIFGLVRQLKKYFDINIHNRSYGILSARIKKEYFVSKRSAARLEEVLDPLKRYRRKAEVIKEILARFAFKYAVDDLRAFVRVLRKAKKRVIEALFGALDTEMREREEKGWKEIKHPGRYLAWMYSRYREGGRAALKSKLSAVCGLRKEALDWLSGEAENDPYEASYFGV